MKKLGYSISVGVLLGGVLLLPSTSADNLSGGKYKPLVKKIPDMCFYIDPIESDICISNFRRELKYYLTTGKDKWLKSKE